jgi:hypothetical protein
LAVTLAASLFGATTWKDATEHQKFDALESIERQTAAAAATRVAPLHRLRSAAISLGCAWLVHLRSHFFRGFELIQ